MSFASLFDVSVDFSTSHLLFPRLIACLLGALGLAILATRWRGMLARFSTSGHWPDGIDKPRFFGTLVLTVAYFTLMPVIGDYFPNEGYGFLICSAPFMFALSVLYMHERSRRNLRLAGLSALIGSGLIWYLMASVFNLSLP
jgi:hypothetical protein